MSRAITVWPRNNADQPRSIDWDEALETFADSFYAQPKTTAMSIEERVHLFIESRYGIFVAPDSVDAQGNPSMSEDDYRQFMAEAAARLK